MDLTPHIATLTQGRSQVHTLMDGSTSLACMGSRALLSLFVCAAPYPESLVGAVTRQEEALAILERERPSFLFATEQLEQGDGVSLVQTCHAIQPALKTLLILRNPSEEKVQQAVHAGCNGVVVESRLADGAMVEAIRAVLGGGVYVDQAGVEALRSSDRASGAQLVEPLSPREREVLEWMMQGWHNKEIAERLVVSPETIKTHVANIISKLQARDRTHAAVVALCLGLVSPLAV